MSLLKNLGKVVTIMTLAALSGIGSVTLKHILDTPQPLINKLNGRRKVYRINFGAISYTVSGDESLPPLLLLHSINAGASSYEMHKLFDNLSKDYQVFAPDLPGFGLSDRPDTAYTPGLYVQCIADFTRDVIKRPATVIAASLTSAFTIQAAYTYPENFSALVLVCPTGIEQLADAPGFVQKVFLNKIKSSFAGLALYSLITTRWYLEYFLRSQIYADKSAIEEDMIQQKYTTTRQIGAQYAPLAFIAGNLNTYVAHEFSHLTHPILVVWGREARITPLHQAGRFLQMNPRATLQVIDGAGAVPYDERPQEFAASVRSWLDNELPKQELSKETTL